MKGKYLLLFFVLLIACKDEKSNPENKEPKAGAGLRIATAYGAPNVDKWIANAKAMGINCMRLTDMIQKDKGHLQDLTSDPEHKFDEMDKKVAKIVASGMTYVLDLSYIRNQLIKEGINPYSPSTDWTPYLEVVLNRTPIKGYTYKNDPHLAFIAIAGEPFSKYNDNPIEKAGNKANLIAFYKRLALQLKRMGVTRPISAGGFLHQGKDGWGTDADLGFKEIWSLPEIDIPTIHVYDDDAINSIPQLVAFCHSIGKPLVIEETGKKYEGNDAERAKWFEKIASKIKDSKAFPDGIGLWNIGEMNGYDVRADEHPITTKTVRELMLLTQSKLLN